MCKKPFSKLNSVWAILLLAFAAFGTNQTSGTAPQNRFAAAIFADDVASWSATAERFRGRNNEQFTFNCPPLKNKLADYTIYGWEIYSDDSSVCAAAVHAGVITTERGGRGAFEIRPGQRSYQYKSSNGIDAYSRGAHPGSFVFVNSNAAPSSASGSGSDSDKVLIKGNPPLVQSAVDKVVKYYEWIFEIEFTNRERAALQNYIVEYWRDKAIQNYVAALGKGFDNIASTDAARAARKREQIITSIPADAEKYPDDPLGKILKPIYDRTRNANAAMRNDSGNRNPRNNDGAATTRNNRAANDASEPAIVENNRRAMQQQPADFSRMPKLRKQPNRAVGWVADAASNPIANANVFTYAYSLVTNQSNRSAAGKTGADGAYSIPLQPITVYETVKAFAIVDYNGRRFYLRCNPVTETKSEKGSIGIVQNFVLTASGLVKEADADPTKSESYLGAQISVEYSPSNPPDADAFSFPPRLKDNTMLTFTFQPVGKIVNGTNGQTLTFQRTMKMLRNDGWRGTPLEESRMLHDIPLGDYKLTVTADIKEVGKMPMRMYGKDNVSDLWEVDEPPTESLTVRFMPEAVDLGGGIKTYQIRLDNPAGYKEK